MLAAACEAGRGVSGIAAAHGNCMCTRLARRCRLHTARCDLHRVAPTRIGASARAAGQQRSTNASTGGCDWRRGVQCECQRQRERGAQRPPPPYLLPHLLSKSTRVQPSRSTRSRRFDRPSSERLAYVHPSVITHSSPKTWTVVTPVHLRYADRCISSILDTDRCMVLHQNRECMMYSSTLTN